MTKYLIAVPILVGFYIVMIPVAVYQVGKAVIQSLKDSYVR